MNKSILAVAAVVVSAAVAGRAEARVPNVDYWQRIGPFWWNLWAHSSGASYHWTGHFVDPVTGVFVREVVDGVPTAIGMEFQGVVSSSTALVVTEFGPASLTLNGLMYNGATPGMLPLNELGEFDPEGTMVHLTGGVLEYDFPPGFPGGPSGMIDFGTNPLSLVAAPGQPFGTWNEDTRTLSLNFMVSGDLLLGDLESSFMLMFMDTFIVPSPASVMIVLAAPCALVRRRRR